MKNIIIYKSRSDGFLAKVTRRFKSNTRRCRGIYGYRLGVPMTMEVFNDREDAIFGRELD